MHVLRVMLIDQCLSVFPNFCLNASSYVARYCFLNMMSMWTWKRCEPSTTFSWTIIKCCHMCAVSSALFCRHKSSLLRCPFLHLSQTLECKTKYNFVSPFGYHTSLKVLWKITNFQSLKPSPTRRLPNLSRRRLANVDEAHWAYLDVPVTHVHVSLHQENLHPDPSLTRNLVTQRGLVTTETMATKDLGTTMTMVVMMGRSGNKMPFRHFAQTHTKWSLIRWKTNSRELRVVNLSIVVYFRRQYQCVELEKLSVGKYARIILWLVESHVKHWLPYMHG